MTISNGFGRTLRFAVRAGVALACLGPTSPGTLAQEPALTGPGAAVYRERCAACHDAGAEAATTSRAPARATLARLSRDAILGALSAGGLMAPLTTGLTAVEKAAVAASLSPGAPPAVDPAAGRCRTPAVATADPSTLPQWNGWGNDPSNARFQSTAAAGLTAQSVPRLRLAWAFGIPGVMAVSAQPTVFGGRVFFGSEAGIVYALDAATGCVRWQFTAGAGVRSAISVGRLDGTGPARYAAYFGDFRAVVYAVDLATGQQVWSVKVDDHTAARITGAPTLAAGRLYVPVSSLEEVPGARPDYPCCSFRGSVVALDATTGRQIWKTYTIAEAPSIVGKNAAGTPLWKPGGAAVWAAPTVDLARRVLYVATGNAYTEPAPPTSDAVIAMSLETAPSSGSRR